MKIDYDQICSNILKFLDNEAVLLKGQDWNYIDVSLRNLKSVDDMLIVTEAVDDIWRLLAIIDKDKTQQYGKVMNYIKNYTYNDVLIGLRKDKINSIMYE